MGRAGHVQAHHGRTKRGAESRLLSVTTVRSYINFVIELTSIVLKI